MITHPLRSLLFLSVFLSAPVHASRTLKVPPISLVTVHGGWLKDPSTGNDRICNTAGMQQLPIKLEGPLCAYHQLNFHLKNLSSTQKQTISVKLMSGSFVISNNSEGAKNSHPGFRNPSSFTLQSNMNGGSFSIPPDGSIEYRLTLTCDSASCKILDNLKGNIDSKGATFVCDGTNTTSPPQVCLDLRTMTIPVFTIEEDSGALVGTVTTVAHRVEGWTDFHLTSPASYQLNGGRPF